MSIINS